MLMVGLGLGGEVHVVSAEDSRDAREWELYSQRRRLEGVKMTPSQAGAVVRGEAGMVRRRLVLGGEGLKREQAEELARWGCETGAEVINHYGPTECTVGVVTHRVEAGEGDVVGGTI